MALIKAGHVHSFAVLHRGFMGQDANGCPSGSCYFIDSALSFLHDAADKFMNHVRVRTMVPTALLYGQVRVVRVENGMRAGIFSDRLRQKVGTVRTGRPRHADVPASPIAVQYGLAIL